MHRPTIQRRAWQASPPISGNFIADEGISRDCDLHPLLSYRTGTCALSNNILVRGFQDRLSKNWVHMNVVARRAARSSTQKLIPLVQLEARKHALHAIPRASFSTFARRRASFPGGSSPGMMMNMNAPQEKGAALKQYVGLSFIVFFLCYLWIILASLWLPDIHGL